MKHLSPIIAAWIAGSQFALAFQIGQTLATFSDPSRGNRSIPTHIFYPADVSGADVPVSDGNFPIVVFGHGFAMEYDAYSNIWEMLVPQGYIVALPNTEYFVLPFPSHADFGADLAFVAERLLLAHNDANSLFYNHIHPEAAIAGHSMGGGCTFLAAENNPDISTIVTFGAAETTPSAIAAAANLTVPSLTLAGSGDCVAPPASHQLPMFNASNPCAHYVEITDASHCQFTNGQGGLLQPAAKCYAGEGFSCGLTTFINIADQHAHMQGLMLPWLDFWLKGECSDWASFKTYLNAKQASGELSHQANCPDVYGNCRLQAHLLLQGAYSTNGSMTTYLADNGLLPALQPYGNPCHNYSGGETATPIPLQATDWVLVELRNATDKTVVERTAAALLRNDGVLLSPDGSEGLLFGNIRLETPYYVVIRHRNHIDLLSSASVEFPATGTYDFANPANVEGGAMQLHATNDGHHCMKAGDFDCNGIITIDDLSLFKAQASYINQYLPADANLDRAVTVDDFNLFVKNAGSVGANEIRY